MKSFIHPKLERKAKFHTVNNFGKEFYNIGKKLFGSIVYVNDSWVYDEEELLALGFEEVVEEKKKDDWKLDLYESLEGLFGKGLDELEEFLAFRKKLEKHMPPQKKFTGNDVHEHSMKTYGSDSGFYVNFTLNFLRDHNLLEE